MSLKRTNYYYPSEVLAQLKALAKKTERPVIWHIRRAIVEYLKRQK